MINITIRLTDWRTDRACLFAVREAVFVQEQNIPLELEEDEWDAVATHAVAETAQGEAIATARLLETGQIGRVAVLKAWRGQGIGALVVQALLEHAQRCQSTPVFLHSQLSALGFYEKAGFVAEGEDFMEDGIPHRLMRFNAMQLSA